MKKFFFYFLLIVLFCIVDSKYLIADQTANSAQLDKRVLLLNMKMPILPGATLYLKEGIEIAKRDRYDLLIVQLDTPGGMLTTLQDMVQEIFKSPVPIVVYVAPSGATATSAGVFITMAAHVAVMAPGTSIGAAHPIDGDGQDIKGDMRRKVENMAAALVRSISDKRGRNTKWAERAVKKSSSITVDEAVRLGVVDIKANHIDEIFDKVEGRVVNVEQSQLVLTGFKGARVVEFAPSLRLRVLNFLSNPTVVGILWLVGTTGIVVELYSPGLILPGIVGAICLVLALISFQILPLNVGAIVLVVIGVLLVFAESLVPSGVLGVGGLVAILVGMVYLVDTSQAPGLVVQLLYIVPFLLLILALLILVAVSLFSIRRHKPRIGYDTLIDREGEVVESFLNGVGLVRVSGEIWKAECSDSSLGIGSRIIVKKKLPGLRLLVQRVAN
jgi:membrane-bound serine protease (ClpP class)